MEPTLEGELLVGTMDHMGPSLDQAGTYCKVLKELFDLLSNPK